jgi:hypothetical protein
MLDLDSASVIEADGRDVFGAHPPDLDGLGCEFLETGMIDREVRSARGWITSSLLSHPFLLVSFVSPFLWRLIAPEEQKTGAGFELAA